MISQTVLDLMKPMPPFIRALRDEIREGRKTQTRRVIDPQPFVTTGFWKNMHWGSEAHFVKGAVEFCRYGRAGDIRYLREPLYHGFGGVAYYQDDDVMVCSCVTGEPITWKWNANVLSQLYMPKAAARTLRLYESIRVERVQKITSEDAKAEGVSNLWKWDAERWDKHPEHFERGELKPYVANFSVLWDEINARRGYGWTVNPWVWVIGFKALTPNPSPDGRGERKE